MVQETRLSVDQLIYPVFVREGKGIREEIPSMPGQYRFSLDTLVEELQSVTELSIPAVILFGIPAQEKKDPVGSVGYARDGVVCQALETARKKVPDLLLIADVCLCEYTDHGHCGIVKEGPVEGQGIVHNDET